MHEILEAIFVQTYSSLDESVLTVTAEMQWLWLLAILQSTYIYNNLHWNNQINVLFA